MLQIPLLQSEWCLGPLHYEVRQLKFLNYKGKSQTQKLDQMLVIEVYDRGTLWHNIKRARIWQQPATLDENEYHTINCMDLDFLYFYDQLLQRFACEGLSTRSYCFLQESLKSFGQSNTRQNYRNCTCCGKLRPRRFQCQRRTNMYVKAKLYIDLDAGGRWGIKSRGSIPIKKVSYCHSVSLP